MTDRVRNVDVANRIMENMTLLNTIIKGKKAEYDLLSDKKEYRQLCLGAKEEKKKEKKMKRKEEIKTDK